MGDVFQRTFLETVFPGSGFSTGLLGIGSVFLDFWIPVFRIQDLDLVCFSDIGCCKENLFRQFMQ